jgi:hypothetical protein
MAPPHKKAVDNMWAMRMALWLLLAGMVASVRGQVLTPTAEFELDATARAHHRDHRVRFYFVASSCGLTLVRISENGVLLTSADLDGRILHSRADLASVHDQIYAALPRPDGSVWLVSGGPYRLLDAGGGGTLRNDLDLYSAAGKHIESLRLLAFVGGAESPIAAGNDELVLRSAGSPRFPPQNQVIHFGTVLRGQFQERARVRLMPPVRGAIATIAGNGELLLIDKKSGDIVVVDPKTKGDTVVRLAEPRAVRAAAADGGYVYLLAADSVVKMDLAGHVIATYYLQLGGGFEAVSLGVTGDLLYLLDKSGRVARFHVQ